jgi:acyl-CoA thioesterase-1
MTVIVAGSGAFFVCMRKACAAIPRSLLLAAVIAALGCDGSTLAPTAPEAPSAPAPPTPFVVALGDSLTAGPGLRADQTYPAILQQRVTAAGYPHRVINAGVSGDTSADALRRFDSAVVPNTRVVILALGANDGLRGVPVESMRQNLAATIERAQARDIRVLLCGMETPPTRGWDYTLAFHRVFPELAARYSVPLMPFLLNGVALNPDFNLEDGFHPNAAGHRRMAENMWPYLEPLLR